ncbi:MAG: UbiA family prenyltransferase [Bacteroidales bacterium]|nr:UbiA family prenyltransferase [Bacteroidales bacterium]
MSSAAVLNYKISILQGVLAFVSVMLFLFHIRVLDESRDFKSDALNTPDSPVHNGTISLRQLLFVDFFGIVLLVGVSAYIGKYAIAVLTAIFIFTAFAWKDFFLKKSIRKSKVLYHIINSPQMLLLHLFIFVAFTGNFYLDTKMWLLMAFAYSNIFVLEVSRKISTDQERPDFKDTYNAKMGLKASVLLTYLLSLISIAFALLINLNQEVRLLYYLFLYFLLVSMVSYSCFSFVKSGGLIGGKRFILSSVLLYLALNILICIAAL